MGISLVLPILGARQVAEFTSQMGGLQGALWAIQILLTLPSVFGSVLWNHCLVCDIAASSLRRR
jgi:hypothetical protein